MKRIIQGLVLAAVASAAQAAPGDAYPTGGAPLFVTAQQTYASTNLREGTAQSVNAYPTGGAPLFVTAEKTYASMNLREGTAQSVNAYPTGGAPLFVTAKQTYADMHSSRPTTGD